MRRDERRRYEQVQDGKDRMQEPPLFVAQDRVARDSSRNRDSELLDRSWMPRRRFDHRVPGFADAVDEEGELGEEKEGDRLEKVKMPRALAVEERD